MQFHSRSQRNCPAQKRVSARQFNSSFSRRPAGVDGPLHRLRIIGLPIAFRAKAERIPGVHRRRQPLLSPAWCASRAHHRDETLCKRAPTENPQIKPPSTMPAVVSLSHLTGGRSGIGGRVRTELDKPSQAETNFFWRPEALQYSVFGKWATCWPLIPEPDDKPTSR